jgi:hypothetical protein
VSSKPSVTLTLAGDEKRLTDAFDRVGQASRSMSDSVGSASRDIASHTKRFDELGEHTDEAERRSLGFKDTLDGLTSGLSTFGDSSLSTTDKLIGLGQAGADLSGGITNFVLPAMSNMVTFMRGPLASAMTFISEHPLLITLGLLAAAVIFLIAQTDWFQRAASATFTWIGHVVSDTFGAALRFVTDSWNWLVGFFEGLPQRIGQALGSLGSWIGNAFKAGLNVVIDVLNWFVDRANDIIYGINVISPFDDIPYIPHIARLHTGGVFHSNSGEGLALLKDGEHVSAPGQGGGAELRVTGSGALFEAIQAAITDGELQLVGR